MPIEENTPILVVVTADRYECFGTPSRWHSYLTDLLMHEMGGVNENVAPGNYHFNAEVLDPTNIVVTLERVE